MQPTNVNVTSYKIKAKAAINQGNGDRAGMQGPLLLSSIFFTIYSFLFRFSFFPSFNSSSPLSFLSLCPLVLLTSILAFLSMCDPSLPYLFGSYVVLLTRHREKELMPAFLCGCVNMVVLCVVHESTCHGWFATVEAISIRRFCDAHHFL